MRKAIKAVIKNKNFIDGIFAPVSSYPIGIGFSAIVFQGMNKF